MRRRQFIALVGGAVAWPIGVSAQQSAAKVRRMGYLAGSSSSTLALLIEGFRQGLRELGWIEGQNIVIDYRFAEGRYDRLPDLAAELVRLNVDIIVAWPKPAGGAGKKGTQPIP